MNGIGPTLNLVRTNAFARNEPSTLFGELLDLVPAELHQESGEVFYSGPTSFEQSSALYLLGFNPGGDPSRAELNRYTIAADLAALRAPDRRDWSGFEDDWREFGTGAVAFQKRVRHLIAACGIDSPRKVPASNALFVRSTRIEALDARRMRKLLVDCWLVHEKVISALKVDVVVCFGKATGRWVGRQLGTNDAPTSHAPVSSRLAANRLFANSRTNCRASIPKINARSGRGKAPASPTCPRAQSMSRRTTAYVGRRNRTLLLRFLEDAAFFSLMASRSSSPLRWSS